MTPKVKCCRMFRRDHVTDEEIAAAIAELRGEISQRPSAVSAIKVGGKRAYQLVREGQPSNWRPGRCASTGSRCWRCGRDGRPFVDLDVEVDCSSGTYIRALARDLGAALGVGGHLTALRRTRVGGFGLDQARTLDELAERPAAEPTLSTRRAC